MTSLVLNMNMLKAGWGSRMCCLDEEFWSMIWRINLVYLLWVGGWYRRGFYTVGRMENSIGWRINWMWWICSMWRVWSMGRFCSMRRICAMGRIWSMRWVCSMWWVCSMGWVRSMGRICSMGWISTMRELRSMVNSSRLWIIRRIFTPLMDWVSPGSMSSLIPMSCMWSIAGWCYMGSMFTM